MSHSISDPEVQSALATCVTALTNMANYQLDSEIACRMHDLGERKEFLVEQEHAELLAFVAFSERRAIEKLQAQLALNQLWQIVPNLRTGFLPPHNPDKLGKLGG